MTILDPIVIDPPGFDVKAAWKECSDYVDQCGGTVHEDGSVNWRAAFAADPGCVACPACKQYYWCWGRVIQCSKCGFHFPTDWWPQYSYGVQHATRTLPAWMDGATRERMTDYYAKQHAESIDHPYYRYGFEHPVDDPCSEKDRIDWKKVLR